MHKGAIRWYLLAALVIVIDQLSKLYIAGHFSYAESLRVMDIFNITLIHNPGAAFSLLSNAGGWQRHMFTLFALVISAIIIRMLNKHYGQPLFAAAITLVMGGALGNVIDRLAYGYVIDFLDFHWGVNHFPAFNVADSAICIGAALMILDGLRKPKSGELAM